MHTFCHCFYVDIVGTCVVTEWTFAQHTTVTVLVSWLGWYKNGSLNRVIVYSFEGLYLYNAMFCNGGDMYGVNYSVYRNR
jgi:hypothetical protein